MTGFALEDPPDDDAPGDRVDEPGPPGGDDTFFGDPRSFLGQEIAVRGEVTEVLSSSDVASAFRMTGDVGGRSPSSRPRRRPTSPRGISSR